MALFKQGNCFSFDERAAEKAQHEESSKKDCFVDAPTLLSLPVRGSLCLVIQSLTKTVGC